MTQALLFTNRVKFHLPPRGGGVDLRAEALAEDGMEWALKRQREHPLLPATEYICYRLARACALATPFDAILTDLDGELVFGSRIEAGLVSFTNLQDLFSRLHTCAPKMSACYALDLLVGNEDRHFGNFLFRVRADGELAAIVIDWSRAWWVRGWPPQSLFSSSCNTTTCMSIMRAMGLWSAADALAALARLTALPASAVDAWAAEMPQQWLPAQERATLAGWWGSPAFHSRIAKCIECCK